MEQELTEVIDGVGNSLQDETERKPLCDNCKMSDNDNATVAERFCIKCEEKLCTSCGQEHENKDEHLVVVLNEQKETKKFKESNFCIVHDEELAELYCACCRKVICGECEQENHSSHNCSRVEDVADLVSKQAEAEYRNLFDIRSHFETERQKLINEKIEVMKTVKDMEAEVQKRFDDITELVYNETKALLKELDVFKKERLEEIQMEMKKMEEHVFTFEKFTEYCDQIKRNTNPRYTCEAEGVLRNIVDDLKSRQEGRWKSRLFPIQFSIEKPDIEQVLTLVCDAIGKLTIRCQYKIEPSDAVRLDEKEVYGMARLHDKLYVLSKSIFIRRLQHPFASVGEIKTPEIQSPKEIVSCSKISCLYIYDKGEGCVWKVSVPDHRVSRWLDKVKEPNALSVTPNAELLILKNNKPVCLEIYNEHAILLRRCQLPASIISLRRLHETPSGKYIGLGDLNVVTLRSNGSIINEFQPSNFPNCRGKPYCLNVSPFHIFLYCGLTSQEKRNVDSRLCYYSKEYYSVHASSISSLTLDLASHQVLVDRPKSDGWRGQVTSCYLKETKQLLVLEEIVSDDNNYKTWNLRACNVLPE